MARNQSAGGEPVGTPPEGGRWTWNGAQWVRKPEAAQITTPAPVADEPQPPSEE